MSADKSNMSLQKISLPNPRRFAEEGRDEGEDFKKQGLKRNHDDILDAEIRIKTQ